MSDKEETNKPLETSENVMEEDTKEKDIEKPLETMPGENRSVPSASAQASVTQEELQNYILTRFLQGASYRKVAEETGMSKTTLHKYYPKNYIENVRANLQKQEQEKLRSQQPPMQQPPPQPIYQEHLDQSALPHGSIVLTPQMIGNIRSGLNATQQRHFDMAINIASQYQDQVLAGSQTRGQPYPQGSLDQAEADLVREMAKTVRFRRYQDMQRGYNPENNPRSANSTLKDAADFIKFGASLVSPNKQQDPLGIYRTGREDAKGELSRLGKSGETNPLDLRLEELRQSHDIDMHKIGFEQKKFFLQLENERDKWDRISETFAPILQSATPEIRKAIRQLGESVGRGIGGAAKPDVQNPNMVSTSCPKCNSPLNIPVPEGAHDVVNVKCPKCGNLFQLEEEKETEEKGDLRPKGRIGSRYT